MVATSYTEISATCKLNIGLLVQIRLPFVRHSSFPSPPSPSSPLPSPPLSSLPPTGWQHPNGQVQPMGRIPFNWPSVWRHRLSPSNHCCQPVDQRGWSICASSSVCCRRTGACDDSGAIPQVDRGRKRERGKQSDVR